MANDENPTSRVLKWRTKLLALIMTASVSLSLTYVFLYLQSPILEHRSTRMIEPPRLPTPGLTRGVRNTFNLGVFSARGCYYRNVLADNSSSKYFQSLLLHALESYLIAKKYSSAIGPDFLMRRTEATRELEKHMQSKIDLTKSIVGMSTHGPNIPCDYDKEAWEIYKLFHLVLESEPRAFNFRKRERAWVISSFYLGYWGELLSLDDMDGSHYYKHARPWKTRSHFSSVDVSCSMYNGFMKKNGGKGTAFSSAILSLRGAIRNRPKHIDAFYIEKFSRLFGSVKIVIGR